MEYSNIGCKQDQEIFPVECLRSGTKEYLAILGNTIELDLRLVFTVITQEIPVTRDLHIAMGIPEKVAEMIADRVGSTVDVFCSSLQEIFSCPKGEVIDFCTNNFEVHNLSEIR